MARVIGAKAHAARLRRLTGERMINQVSAALLTAGEMIEKEAEISITAGSITGLHHVPSKPGEPPNNDAGDLVRGIETVLVAPLKVEVSSNAPHAAALEFGTSKMVERPYLRPATQKKRKEAVELVRRAVQKVIRETR